MELENGWLRILHPSNETADNALESEKPSMHCILSKDASVHIFPEFSTKHLIQGLANLSTKQTTKKRASSFLKNPQKFRSI